jgi:catechol 2,3-dioxygenase-like lactoylglutathione lyase family enzyme
MPVAFNHCIVFANDADESASFFAEVFGLPAPVAWGPFRSLALADGVVLQFAVGPAEVQPQHYAILATDEEFDAIYGRLVASRIDHWADPRVTQPGAFNMSHGGRGVYFLDPAGHGLEISTRPDGLA